MMQQLTAVRRTEMKYQMVLTVELGNARRRSDAKA